MSMMMITTAVALSAAASSHSGGGGSCPVSDFGWVCLAIFGGLMLSAVVSLLAAVCSDYSGKWQDRFLGASIFCIVASFIPVIVGMIHDC